LPSAYGSDAATVGTGKIALTILCQLPPPSPQTETSVNAAPRLATRTPGQAATRTYEASAPRRVFAEIEIFADPIAVRHVFAEMEPDALATPYQRCDFVAAWLRTIGRAEGATALIVVVRDDRGIATAILPLAVIRRNGFRTAKFVGGKHANFHMGIFRRGLLADREAIAGLLQRIGRLAGLDALLLINQPDAWQGEPNPLATLPRQDSPSAGHATKLERRFDDWFILHYSKNGQKKLRKKARDLAEKGAVSTIIARDEATARRVLAAFFAQKREQAKANGLVNDFQAPEAARFLELAATDGLAEGRQALELHALVLDERILAVFGGLAGGGRFCGMITSHNVEPEIARCSPGELLMLEVIRNATERGFSTFDLGVGEARYKDVFCEIDERLSDSAISFTAKGRLLAAAFLSQQRLKRWIKHTPQALRLANGLMRSARWTP
jgi:CelD/BcsL family acetyltransferase involved in cellulose biosynthesis